MKTKEIRPSFGFTCARPEFVLWLRLWLNIVLGLKTHCVKGVRNLTGHPELENNMIEAFQLIVFMFGNRLMRSGAKGYREGGRSGKIQLWKWMGICNDMAYPSNNGKHLTFSLANFHGATYIMNWIWSFQVCGNNGWSHSSICNLMDTTK